MKSKCCNARLEFVIKLESTDNKNVPFIVPEGISPPGLPYNLCRCGKCGLMYCIKDRIRKIPLDEPDEWE